ncbi:MAG TPA: 16S rRNA (cytosine(1402)-N(4))-methyltransferase RsmH [Verrucomicrobiae bacterium]|nr:16S rRNA (cytosine(1402)-N(4))-methyltransferase RsmH [Verrucomicrobiae bacterium]
MHRPVLVQEALSYWFVRPEGVYVDATLGGGGHTKALLEHPRFRGTVIGIDRDRMPEEKALENPRFSFYRGNFAGMPDLLAQGGVAQLSGILFDFGLSSEQLDDPARGLSFQLDGPLDMRFDREQPLTAEKILNEYPEEKLSEIFHGFGEEPKARALARFLVRTRQKERITTTGQLRKLLFAFWRKPDPRRFLARIFQALRIAVNDELQNIQRGLSVSLPLLEPGGRLVAISYHSLEDRLVKDFFRRESSDCICPPGLPVCQCGHRASLRILTSKPVVPSQKEKKENPRSASAKLRAAEKI